MCTTTHQRGLQTYQETNVSVTASTAWNIANTIQYIIHCVWVGGRGYTYTALLHPVPAAYIFPGAACSHSLEGGVGWIEDACHHAGCSKTIHIHAKYTTLHLHNGSRENNRYHIFLRVNVYYQLLIGLQQGAVIFNASANTSAL